MKKEPSKKEFFGLLGKAISSPPAGKKSGRFGGYSGKRTRQHNAGGASGKRSGKSLK